MKKASYYFLSILLPCLFLSCNYKLLNTQNDQEKSTGKARIFFSVQVNETNERFIAAQPFNQDDITGVELVIQSKAGEDSYNYSSIDELCKSVHDLEPAIYNFYLKIYTNNIENENRKVLSATNESIVVNANETIHITFNAKYVTTGDLSITFKYKVNESEGNRIGFTKIGLYDSPLWVNPVSDYALKSFDVVKEEAPESNPEQTQTESFYFTNFTAKEIPNGLYYIKIETYDTDTDEENEASRLLNVFSDQVQVYGYKTFGTIYPENYTKYNKNFYIDYVLNEGTIIDESAFIKKHNQYTEVTLPTDKVIKRTGYTFEGWSESEDFTGQILKGLTAQNGTLTKDVTLYAKWTDGDNPVLTNTELNPYYNEGTPSITFTATDTNEVSDIQITITKDGTELKEDEYESNGITITEEGNATPTMTTKVTFSVDGTYSISAIALDGVSNRSEPVSASTTIDTIAPTITITSPTGEETGTNAVNETNFLMNGTASDTNEINAVWYKVIASSATAPAAPTSNILTDTTWTKDGWTNPTGTTSWNATQTFKATGASGDGLEEGEYKIYVYAVDRGGNVSARAEKTFDVDMSAPSIEDTSTVASITNAAFEIKGTASDTRGLAKVIVTDSLSGTEYDAKVTGTTWTVTFGNTENPIEDGSRTFTAVATDVVGKTSSITRSVTYDTTAPALTSTTLESLYKKNSTPSITITAADANEISDIQITITKNGSELAKEDYESNGITLTKSSSETTETGSRRTATVSFTADGDHDGEFSITAVATDIADNESEPNTWSTVIDATMENVISISINSGDDSLIDVVVTVDGEVVENDTGISGNTITFTADTSYTSYTWKIDGVVQTFPSADNNNILTIDTSKYVKGTYDVSLLSVKTVNGKEIYDSYYAQIKISE
ncbi:MAG: InlB B-repeat-containing protein [Treponema sp.]|nr:InlB B-repeat-containing protein [Treponema sp.]